MLRALVLAGTQEGRVIAERLTALGVEVTASSLTAHGAGLIPPECAVRWGPLDEGSLREVLDGVDLLVDATHPYARRITALAREAAAGRGIPYLRLSRPRTEFSPDLRAHRCGDIGEACRLAFDHGRRVFSAIGSRNLGAVVREARRRGGEVIARVLPDPGSLATCLDLGLSPAGIVAIQGPFSRELNRELFRHYRCDVLLTKDGGDSGGTREKVEAAAELGLTVVLWDREAETGPGVYENIGDLIEAARRLMEGEQ